MFTGLFLYYKSCIVKGGDYVVKIIYVYLLVCLVYK